MGIVHKLLFLFILQISFGVAISSTFVPGHYKILFSEMDGWVYGEVKDISYKKNYQDEIITVLTINLLRSSGIKKSSIPNSNNFQVNFRGGKWQGVNYKFSGTPDIKIGQKYTFLLNKNKGGFYLAGFDKGVIRDSKENQIVLADLKKYSLKKFNDIFDVNLSNKNLDRVIRPRMPATAKIIKNEKQQLSLETSENHLFIIVMILMMIVLIFLYLSKNENIKD